jgi:hypothetical protein
MKVRSDKQCNVLCVRPGLALLPLPSAAHRAFPEEHFVGALFATTEECISHF